MAVRKRIFMLAPALFLTLAAALTAGMNETLEGEDRSEKAKVGAVVLPVLFNMPETNG